MVAARDILARTLSGEVKNASSVELTAAMSDLTLDVEGIGHVRFPLTPSKVRRLIEYGEPARFGRGAQTLTDPDVRDTWEIPKRLVSAVWNDASLTDILAGVKDELGLPHRAELTADLHSLLVYEPGQFFLAHQDSEKDDSMIGTLVVTLPSSYTGGELVVERGEEVHAYRGSRSALSLVAFYADCRHEVLRVKSGYRIALTYNLLLRGDTGRQEGDAGTISELTSLLLEHFDTPAPRYHRGPATDAPIRLVYLLDHEYTPRALSWDRLKGADAGRVSLLRAAAGTAGCETTLALVDIRTTHGAFAADDGYEYRDGFWPDDRYEADDDDAMRSGGLQDYQIHELIDSEVALTRWTGPNGTRLEETSLRVAVGEVCASTPTDELKPRESQYEGYMGNWGNTLDRWYHRAAVVVWPRALAFANRAEPSPVWALEQLTAMASAGDVAAAQAAAATLEPFWDGTVRPRLTAENGDASRLFDQALRAADAVADPASAGMLLRPFRVENLTATTAVLFANIADRYGQRWTTELLGAWFAPEQPPWPSARWERPRWIADSLPSLCEGLHDLHAVSGVRGGTAAAQYLLDRAWEWTEEAIRSGLGLTPPSQRDRQLGELGKPLAALLSAAARIAAIGTRDAIVTWVRKQDAVTTLEMSALRAGAAPTPGKDASPSDIGLRDLADDCAARLRSRLDRPFRAHDDWSIELPADGCPCDWCGVLRRFLADPGRIAFEWRLAKERRQHIHAKIDSAELPVTHETRRKGSPYTLVLKKSDALFTGDLRSRASAAADLEWLTATWPRAIS